MGATICAVCGMSGTWNLEKPTQYFETAQRRLDGSVFRHRQHSEPAEPSRIDQAKHRRLRRDVLLHRDARFLLHGDQLLTQPERGEEIALRRQTGELQPGSLSRPNERAEIHMGGEILMSNPQKGIVSHRVSGISTHGSF